MSTCGHIKQEGEDAPPVVPGPQDPAGRIKGEREHAARQLTGAPLHLLPRGDVHHVEVVLAVPHLHHTVNQEASATSS